MSMFQTCILAGKSNKKNENKNGAYKVPSTEVSKH